ncbi:ExbD/TolR family protein [Aporhodopirellula aestuarii]|uniref:Biopolymer transporter ExbD n=1 Tax=Aporhodopirellula aestuarii TaxID=2950107 RepID=A0ABT0UBV4_9BACT|nr:biopolymer transporter ExbD [Aporhodopirellula aestuarii]MCM2374354.1 biopolymer transporter ExbD [Aporhodopirellula aestuarii]
MIRRSPPETATINLTPMIDVVFLLVIFFMVGSKFDNGEDHLQVNVPGVAEMRSMARLPDERIVEFTSAGVLRLDGAEVSPEQLTGLLRSQHQSYPALKVAVRADDNIPYGQVAEVLQRVRASGVDQIGVATQKR